MGMTGTMYCLYGGGGVGDSEGLSLLRLSYPFTHILNKISAQFAGALEGKEEKKASETFPHAVTSRGGWKCGTVCDAMVSCHFFLERSGNLEN